MFIPNCNKGCFVSLVLTLVVCISVIVGKYYHIKNNNIIEQDIELQKHNDSLKFKVNNLDSIKNAKVIEVQKLDNDSTVKLFYKLIE
nr:MAG TPA: hypothetical protein [Crassvirales sp.]